MYKFYQTKLSPAFTIIELLITIVIVGILVAITAVGYGGVTKRAEYANIQTSVSGIEKAIEVFFVDNGVYPTSITDCPNPAAAAICTTAPAGMTLQYAYFPKGTRVQPEGPHTTILSDEGFYELSIQGSREFIYSSKGVTRGGNEFMKYTDLAPFINKYGLKKYVLEFDIRSLNVANASSVNAYFQNGNGSRHSFNVGVPVTTQDKFQKIEFTPTLSSSSTVNSTLAFYGTYSTGNVPIVSNVRFYLAP